MLPSGGARRESGAAPRRAVPALPIDVARTIEELLSTVTLDFVHVHEPFAPSTSNAALRHSRALNVGTLPRPLRAAALPLMARRLVRPSSAASMPAPRAPPPTAALMDRHFPGDYRLLAREGSRSCERRWRSSSRSISSSPPAATTVAATRSCAAGSGERPLIDVDLHMHTDHSGDCATPVEVLLATARERGLGAIAVTDHNEISGALAAPRQLDSSGSPRA